MLITGIILKRFIPGDDTVIGIAMIVFFSIAKHEASANFSVVVGRKDLSQLNINVL